MALREPLEGKAAVNILLVVFVVARHHLLSPYGMVPSLCSVARRLDHNRSRHVWVQGAEILVGPCLVEGKREAVAGVERFGLEHPGLGNDRVWDVVLIQPGYSRLDLDGEAWRGKGETFDLHRRVLCKRGASKYMGRPE
jgi:hypothetical protein